MTEQEDVKFLRSKKFRVYEMPTRFKFEVEPRGMGANDIPDLYIAKDECEVMQRIGVILEIRSDVYRDGRPPTFFIYYGSNS
jgi:hypothetical protein